MTQGPALKKETTMSPVAPSTRTPHTPRNYATLATAMLSSDEPLNDDDLRYVFGIIAGNYEQGRVTAGLAYQTMHIMYSKWQKNLENKGKRDLASEVACTAMLCHHIQGEGTYICNISPCKLLEAQVKALAKTLGEAVRFDESQRQAHCSRNTMLLIVDTLAGNCQSALSEKLLLPVIRQIYPGFSPRRTPDAHREAAVAARSLTGATAAGNNAHWAVLRR